MWGKRGRDKCGKKANTFVILKIKVCIRLQRLGIRDKQQSTHTRAHWRFVHYMAF